MNSSSACLGEHFFKAVRRIIASSIHRRPLQYEQRNYET
jgi:hypothetical protein